MTMRNSQKNLRKRSWERTGGTAKWDRLDRLEYVAQVGQGQGGLHIGWDRMGLGHGGLQIRWDKMGLGQVGLQIRWDRMGLGQGSLPSEPVFLSFLLWFGRPKPITGLS